MTRSGRLYMTHYNRGESYCPLCYASVVWRKVGEHKYCPCDRLPVLCIRDSGTNFRAVKNGEILSGVKILTPENAAGFVGKKPFHALQPHVFTCPALKHCRKGGKS